LIFILTPFRIPLVIVCSCHGITDREIRKHACEGARTPRQVAEACGAGSVCGGCRPVVREILEETHSPRALTLVRVEVSATEAA
jgi:bacterioferritin-associated ferredoxin